MQVIFSDGNHGVLSPDRDLVHALPQLVQATAQRFASGAWPEMLAWLENPPVGMTPDQVNAAGIAAATFFSSCLNDPKETMKDVLNRVGWFDLKTEAKIGYLAMLGTTMMGYYFNGCRDAAIDGRKPNAPFEKIVADWVEKGLELKA